MWHHDKCPAYPFYQHFPCPPALAPPLSSVYFSFSAEESPVVVAAVSHGKWSKPMPKQTEKVSEGERDRQTAGVREGEREGALKSCQAGPKTSTPSPKNRERIDRNYAIKIKQCGVIFMVRFSMRTDTHTHTKRENERRALAKVRVSLRLSERDGTKVIIYNCPCCSNCSFNSAAADKIVSYCRRCGAGRTRLSQGQGQGQGQE